MSVLKDVKIKPITVKKVPVVLKKDNIMRDVSKGSLLANVKLCTQSFFKEDLLYESKSGDFLKGETQKIKIVNRLNLLTNCSRTIAKCETKYGVVEKTSDNITKLIGQANYDTLLSALSSVFNQEMKIRGILALLTLPKGCQSKSCQTQINSNNKLVRTIDNSSQTEESCMEKYVKLPPRKRIRRKLTTYVVKDSAEKVANLRRRIIIHPDQFKDGLQDNETQAKDHVKVSNKNPQDNMESLPVLRDLFDGNSNDSMGNFSSLSIETTRLYPMIDFVDKHIRADLSFEITTYDGTKILVPQKPVDEFHLATKVNLQCLASEERRKLLFHQVCLDLKLCLTKDNDGNLPIHTAVLHNDLDLLRRQCLVLKTRNEPVDTPSSANMSALQMAISPHGSVQATATLLSFGADPLLTDEEHRNSFHLAAEVSREHLQVLVQHCRTNARKILFENEDLWKPGLEDKTDEDLASHLMHSVCKMCDDQGYTPLMLASKVGKHENVDLLTQIAPEVVNMQMPNSGNTALYLAVGAAYLDAENRGDKSKIADNFCKTIKTLLKNGASPSIDNYSGSNVNTLLTEFNIGVLSMLIANTLTSIKCKGNVPEVVKICDSYMWVKDENGELSIKNIKKKPIKLNATQKTDIKPVIVGNTVSNDIPSSSNSSVDIKSTKSDINFLESFKKFVTNKSSIDSKVIVKSDTRVTTPLKIKLEMAEKAKKQIGKIDSTKRALQMKLEVPKKKTKISSKGKNSGK